MSEQAIQQSAANHARYVPGYHFVAGSLALLNLVWTLYRVATRPNGDTYAALVVAITLMLVFWYARQFPLAAQDRLIRLEERLRLARLMPPEMLQRCDDLTPSQLIALRFASDAELPQLATKVINDGITGRAQIKAMIRDWRPDHLRV
jgi:hypothetical protein